MYYNAVHIAAILFFVSNVASAAEWCTVSSGYGVTENRETVTLNGTLTGASGSAHKEWLVLDSANAPDAGKKRLGLALTAKAMGKTLQVYVGDPYNCITVPHWQLDVIWHMRMQ